MQLADEMMLAVFDNDNVRQIFLFWFGHTATGTSSYPHHFRRGENLLETEDVVHDTQRGPGTSLVTASLRRRTMGNINTSMQFDKYEYRRLEW